MASFLQKPVEKRREEALRLLKKYEGKYPVILQLDRNSRIEPMQHQKLIVDGEMTVGQLLFTIRKRIKLDATKALYLFFNNELVNSGITMKEIYYTYHSRLDDMLYATYSTESTFGFV